MTKRIRLVRRAEKMNVLEQLLSPEEKRYVEIVENLKKEIRLGTDNRVGTITSKIPTTVYKQ